MRSVLAESKVDQFVIGHTKEATKSAHGMFQTIVHLFIRPQYDDCQQLRALLCRDRAFNYQRS